MKASNWIIILFHGSFMLYMTEIVGMDEGLAIQLLIYATLLNIFVAIKDLDKNKK